MHWALGATRGLVYEPMSWVLKSAQFAAFGLSPSAFAAVSAAAHVITVLVTYLTLELILSYRGVSAAGGGRLGAMLAATWWGVHPLRVESVAWLSAQPYCFAGLFGSISLYCHVRYSLSGTKAAWLWLAASALGYSASAFSKSVAIPVVAIHIALELLVFHRKDFGAVRNIAKALVNCSTHLLVTVVAIWATVESNDTLGVGKVLLLNERFVITARTVVRYGMQSALPVGITAFYRPELDIDVHSAYCVMPLLLVCFGVFYSVSKSVFAVASNSWELHSAALFLLPVAIVLPTLSLFAHGTDSVGADRLVSCVS